ncbi:MAG: type II toxin-antitoxin system ParD family antitoxin [Myxococcales bacterium]|nr:type II toxin-antitoxin system ParD family antitoxin [Myxococcales bacterium]
MSNTSISLGNHWVQFISEQVDTGRYRNASEVIRASLRLLEAEEQRQAALRRLLREGAASGDAGILDMGEIKTAARRAIERDSS